MAAFDPSKYKIIKEWETGQDVNDLVITVFKYGNGQPKVKFSKYYQDRNTNELKSAVCKNLQWDDLMFIEQNWDEIKETLENVK